MSLPGNYSRLSVSDRTQAVVDELVELGFAWDDEIEWYWKQAVQEFNAATIVQVFGLAQILADEHPLTVRGAMYRGVGTIFPDTSDTSYDKCGRLILELRRKGFIPWNWIVDGTRSTRKPSSWSGLADFAESVAQAYRKNLWQQQEDYLDIFVEKDAMTGILYPVTHEYDVALEPIRGDISETFCYNIAAELKEIQKPIYVYYLGDHDPKGFQIESVLRWKLEKYSERELIWERLAITPEDFSNSEIIGFPVKKTYKNGKPVGIWKPYLEEFGDRCVEVDAIPASETRERARKVIESHIDQEDWGNLRRTEGLERQSVLEVVRGLGGSAA
jgi:hypothetical protein